MVKCLCAGCKVKEKLICSGTCIRSNPYNGWQLSPMRLWGCFTRQIQTNLNTQFRQMALDFGGTFPYRKAIRSVSQLGFRKSWWLHCKWGPVKVSVRAEVHGFKLKTKAIPRSPSTTHTTCRGLRGSWGSSMGQQPFVLQLHSEASAEPSVHSASLSNWLESQAYEQWCQLWFRYRGPRFLRIEVGELKKML